MKIKLKDVLAVIGWIIIIFAVVVLINFIIKTGLFQ